MSQADVLKVFRELLLAAQDFEAKGANMPVSTENGSGSEKL
jgi:hypothetical protein